MEQLTFLGKCMWKGVQALAFDQVFSTSCIHVTISLPPQKYWKTSLEKELAKAITEIWLREGNFDIHWGGYIFFWNKTTWDPDLKGNIGGPRELK